MKVLVTGAAGFIGRHVVPGLAASGYTPRVLVSMRSAQSAHYATAFTAVLPANEIHVGTLPDAALAARLCENVDVVIHIAGLAHVNADATALRTANLDATLELAQAARAKGVRRFIFVSSSKARYPMHSLYARLKAEAEEELRKLHSADFETVCIRPALVYGPGMRGNLSSLLRVLSRRFLPVFPASEQPLGMISVNDVAQALTRAVSAPALPDRIWELADGQHYTLNGIVRDVRAIQGLPLPMWGLPRALFHVLASVAGMSGASLSLGTYRALFAEPYEYDAAFSAHTGFVAKDTFAARLPELLEELH